MTTQFRSLRIVQLMQTFRSGGLELLVLRLSESLQHAGHHPLVIAMEDGPVRDLLERAGIDTMVLFKGAGFRPNFWLRLAKELRRHCVDLVHSHHFGPLIYATPVARALGLPLVHTVHSNEHLVQASLKHRLLFHGLTHACDRVTTVNEELAAFIQGRFSLPVQKLCVVANGIDAARFHGAHPTAGIREAWDTPPEAVVFGVVARLEPEKGHTTLLQAMARMTCAPYLWVIGTGSLRQALGNEAAALGLSSRLRFLGLRDDIPALLAACDVFVLPSLREGLPLALLEAMASGLPVVASAVGGVPSVIEQSGGGVSVPPEDPRALAGTLEAMVDKPTMRKDMAHAGQRWVRAHASHQVMVDAYLEVYDDVLA